MRPTSKKVNAFALLEMLLALAMLCLILLLFPGLLAMLDVRNWTRPVWFGVNVALALILLAIRFAPDSFYQWQNRHTQNLVDRAATERQQAVKERREWLRRIRESRRRRMY